jgi:hypothetical protein
MTYPPVTQFETRASEAEARARLAREQGAARVKAPSGPTRGRARLFGRKVAPLPDAGAVRC